MGFPELLAGVDKIVRTKLGGLVTYAPSTGDPVTVNGVFDASYDMVSVGRAGVSGYAPAVFLTLSDLPSDPTIDTPAITVGSVEYKIREVKPDGLGGVWILLHEAD